MHKVQEDVECPGEDDGEEEGEAGQIHITLGAVVNQRCQVLFPKDDTQEDALEFPSRKVRLGANVCLPLVVLGLGGKADHPLNGI